MSPIEYPLTPPPPGPVIKDPGETYVAPISSPAQPPPPPNVDPLPSPLQPPPPPQPVIGYPTQMGEQNQFTLNPENFAQLGTRVDSIEDRLGKLGTTLDSQFGSPQLQMGIGGYGGFGSPYGFNPYASMGGGFSSPFSSPLYGGIGQYFPFF
jgi:hypothetical protein